MLHECNGDYDKAIQQLIKTYRAMNPNFVYNRRQFETPEQAELRKKFRRMQNKLLRWKKSNR